MDVLTSFLENSSIHGLGYVAQTKAFRRAFWICTVLCGFIGAGILIYQSFDNWSQHPVTTTIETKPITDIKFPKVTICPPKKTYTNINYDLININAEMTLADGIKDRNEQRFMINLLDRVFDAENEEALKLYFEERDKYRNWYDGHSYEENPLDVLYDQMDEREIESIGPT